MQSLKGLGAIGISWLSYLTGIPGLAAGAASFILSVGIDLWFDSNEATN